MPKILYSPFAWETGVYTECKLCKKTLDSYYVPVCYKCSKFMHGTFKLWTSKVDILPDDLNSKMLYVKYIRCSTTGEFATIYHIFPYNPTIRLCPDDTYFRYRYIKPSNVRYTYKIANFMVVTIHQIIDNKYPYGDDSCDLL